MSVVEVEDPRLTYRVYLTEFRTSCEGESVNLRTCNREGNDYSIAPELAGMSSTSSKRVKGALSSTYSPSAHCTKQEEAIGKFYY